MNSCFVGSWVASFLWAGKPAALAMNGSGTDDLFYGIDCGMKPLGDYTFTAEQDGKTILILIGRRFTVVLMYVIWR